MQACNTHCPLPIISLCKNICSKWVDFETKKKILGEGASAVSSPQLCLSLRGVQLLETATRYRPWHGAVQGPGAALLPRAIYPWQGKPKAFIRRYGQEDLNLKENPNQLKNVGLLSTEGKFSLLDAPGNVPNGAYGPYPVRQV